MAAFGHGARGAGGVGRGCPTWRPRQPRPCPRPWPMLCGSPGPLSTAGQTACFEPAGARSAGPKCRRPIATCRQGSLATSRCATSLCSSPRAARASSSAMRPGLCRMWSSTACASSTHRATACGASATFTARAWPRGWLGATLGPYRRASKTSDRPRAATVALRRLAACRL